MKVLLVALVAAVVCIAGPAMAQEADQALFAQGCNALEGAPPGVCECAAAKLAGVITPAEYNQLAQAWVDGQAQTPEDAESMFSADVIDAVDSAFEACME
ncbi:MAG: hypothetical protein D6E12_11900 [Desulfovibrio sp.]|nr:MAG: hypothetical protein D6E12_11900 [Desulfovibrio sp.]